MTPEQCFDAMAKVLGHSNPQDIGYIQLLEDVKKLEVELDEARTEVATLIGKHITKDKEIKELKEELQEEKDGREHDVQQFQSVLEEKGQLEAEVEELKDFTHWENHPALKHKVVLDDDYYLEHVEGGPDIETFSLLQEENKKLKTQMDALRKQTCCMGGEKLEDRIGEIIQTKNNYRENVKRLEKENKELKEENDTQKLMVDGLVKTIQELKEQRKKKIRASRAQEVVKLKEAQEATANFWQCLMDCRGNPDNPDKQEIDEWCDAYNKSDKVRQGLYASAGVN